MGKRKRRGFPSTPISRINRYVSKLDPSLNARIIDKQKDLMIDAEKEYQVEHSVLINKVISLLEQYPEEMWKRADYIAAGQGFWYCSKRYTGKSKLRCAVQNFLYWKAYGLNEIVLRRIATLFGIYLPGWDEILGLYLNVPISIGVGQTVWGIPVVAYGQTLPIYLHAESSGLTIKVRVRKPDGTTYETTAVDLGDGNYKVEIFFDQRGLWLLEAVFPDGFKRKKAVYVS